MRISDWSSDVCSSDLESILLRLVETVNLIDEKYGAPALPLCDLCGHDGFAYVFDAAQHSRHGQELCIEAIGRQARQGRLAHARRPPADHEMRPSELKGNPQRLARAQPMGLPDHLAQRSCAHTFGTRPTRPRTGRPLDQHLTNPP